MPPELEFIHLSFQAQSLVIGEGIKKGTFRPSIETLPSSVLAGAFADNFGGLRVEAIGFLRKESYQKAYFVYSPRDPLTDSSVLPITVEYLMPASGHKYVEGDVYVPRGSKADQILRHLPLDIHIGGLRYKGFGHCHLTLRGTVKVADTATHDTSTVPMLQGYFKGRVRESEIDAFAITPLSARYGYLFEPHPNNTRTGHYRRSLFEGSLVKAPGFMISQEYKYDN